jgi:pSer/pThr/pTyr-binding forkhead associated (FHA) protein/type II secretory pathway predicted ATPase ExeA
MDLGAAGLNEQPFRTHGRPLATVSYASHAEGLKTLEECCTQANGLALIQGPTLSGKSTLISQFVESLPEETSVAVVDGKGLNTAALLKAVLTQFGFSLDQNSTNELLGLLRVYTLQQAAVHEAPILIIENTYALKASALRALCELADLKVRGTSALKMVLVSDRPLLSLVKSPEMKSLARRLTHDFHMRPMSNDDTTQYLYAKLRAAGNFVPEFVFPLAVCNELWRASGGWPGILDRIALLALGNAEMLPVPREGIERPVLPQGTWLQTDDTGARSELTAPIEQPTLYVSHDGEMLQEIRFDLPRLLVGRSEHNDIQINSKFVSRHHALLVRNGRSTFLMDLNSTNGTLVNSRRVSNHILIHDDVITIGNHRIKFKDPYATKRGQLDGSEFEDTVIMKSLVDMRRLLAQENTEMLPSMTENLPTAGL